MHVVSFGTPCLQAAGSLITLLCGVCKAMALETHAPSTALTHPLRSSRRCGLGGVPPAGAVRRDLAAGHEAAAGRGAALSVIDRVQEDVRGRLVLLVAALAPVAPRRTTLGSARERDSTRRVHQSNLLRSSSLAQQVRNISHPTLTERPCPHPYFAPCRRVTHCLSCGPYTGMPHTTALV